MKLLHLIISQFIMSYNKDIFLEKQMKDVFVDKVLCQKMATKVHKQSRQLLISGYITWVLI